MPIASLRGNLIRRNDFSYTKTWSLDLTPYSLITFIDSIDPVICIQEFKIHTPVFPALQHLAQRDNASHYSI